MARVVIGIGSAHGPTLLTPSELWHMRVPADRAMMHHYRRRMWSFDALRVERAAEHLADQVRPEVMKAREKACRTGIDTLADRFAEADPDVVVIIGNDQMEMFDGSFMPSLAVFCGQTFRSSPLTPERLAQLPSIVKPAMLGYVPEGGAAYPIDTAFADHIIAALITDGFDITTLTSQPKPECPHAFGYTYRQIMRDRLVPSVPIFLNTFYPPNQPTAQRCLDFGLALLDGIQSWDPEIRVAVVATGGLSHFVIDEDLDRAFFDALRERRVEFMSAHDEAVFQDGTSEWKNWIPLAAMMAGLSFEPTIVDYVPCYRSEAGTGTAMGFVYWLP